MNLVIKDLLTNEVKLEREYNAFALDTGTIRFSLKGDLLEDIPFAKNRVYVFIFLSNTGKEYSKVGTFEDYQYSESSYDQIDEKGEYVTTVGSVNNSLIFRI